jgi:hypothetical protein
MINIWKLQQFIQHYQEQNIQIKINDYMMI